MEGISEQEVIRLGIDLCNALELCGAKNIIHRDIKPANILFDERNRAVLIDFGVSKYVESKDDTTTTSSLVGFSRGFAPLEQVNATISSLTPATDMYALGATLYNLVVGTIPPDASLVMDSGLPEMPAGISDEVKNAVTSCMQPRKKDRPQDVRSFLEMLPGETAVQGEEDATVVLTPESLSSPKVSSSVGIWKIASCLLLCVSLVFGGLYFWNNKDAGPDNSGEIETLTSTNEELQKQVNDLQSKEKSLTQSNSSLRKQVDDLKGQVSTQSGRINSLQNGNANLKKQVNEYKPKAERWDRSMNSK